MTLEDCPSCRQHFYSALSLEAHKQLYPSHFSGEKTVASTKEDAVLCSPRIKRGKKQEEVDKNVP